MARAGYIARIARRAAASAPAPLRPRRVPARLPGDGVTEEASAETEAYATAAPGFAHLLGSPDLSTVVAPRSTSAPAVAVAPPPVSAARATPPAAPLPSAVTEPGPASGRARRARSKARERDREAGGETIALPSPGARTKPAIAEPVAARFSTPERVLDPAKSSDAGRSHPRPAATTAFARASALPQRNVPAGPDPLALALAAAVRWTTSDERPTPRAAAPVVAQAPSTDAPARREEPPTTPPVDASPPVTARATPSTIVPRAVATAPRAPRSTTPAPPAAKGSGVHIGSLHVEVLPAPQPTAREPRRDPVAAPTASEPLARGLTSHIGLRQS